MKTIDYYLHKITMYQLLVYGLFVLVGISMLFSITETLGFGFAQVATGFSVVMASGYLGRIALTKLYGVVPNKESMLISALIVFFVFSPPSTVRQAVLLAIVTLLAMASRYVIAYRKKHLFNPVAIAATIVGLVGIVQASWWVGNEALAIFVAIFGLLVLRKLRRFQLFAAFAVTAIAMLVMRDAQDYTSVNDLFKNILISSPLLFLGTIMLTEPSTLPPTRRMQLVYGALVGGLYASGLHVGDIYLTPELALVVGNLVAYSMSSSLRKRVVLTLQKRTEIAPGIYELQFSSDTPLTYVPGQYIDITLPVQKCDSRGNRRTFTIASAPHEKCIIITFNTAKKSSSFKKSMLTMPLLSTVYGDRVAGDFTMPRTKDAKVVWIAGGIGITPFRSMAVAHSSADCTLMYITSKAQQRVYVDVFTNAGIPIVDGISAITNPTERMYYISGPHGFVEAQKATLKKLSISQNRIKTDYFSGY